MRVKVGTILLSIAAVIAFATAIAHLSCLYLGAQCYAAQMAPKIIVDSAVQGTLVAPIANIVVSALFVIAGLYALAGGRIIKRLPGLRFILTLVAAICLIRGLLPVFVWLLTENQLPAKVFIASFIWFFVGTCYWFGWILVTKKA